MQRLLFTLATVLLSYVGTTAQNPVDTVVRYQILAMDSLLFEEGFNRCNIAILNDIVAADLEFYHDISGSGFGKEKFVKSIKENICNISYRPFRILPPSGHRIDELKSNGEVYGALHSGIHEFYADDGENRPYLTSRANFMHFWKKEGDNWYLKRVFSYNHIAPKDHTISERELKVNFIDSLRRINKIPVLGIATLKNGKLQSPMVFGELEKGVSAPVNTIFNVASLTKPIVTMVTLTLVEQGQWNLDEPLFHFWTDPDVINDPYSKILTTRHILSHQSGFKNWRHQHKSGRLTFDFEPGKGFGYSGEGFEYLKKALEAKFEKGIEMLADSLLFAPLDMKDTFFYWSDEVDEQRFARWHDKEGKNTYETYKNTSASAADDLLTTLEDYGRFAAFILNGAGLSNGLFDQMVTQQNAVQESVKMGLGWEILPNLKHDEYAILHTGGDRGVNTLIILMPKTGEGLIVFTNSDNGNNVYFPIIEHVLSAGKQIVGKAE